MQKPHYIDHASFPVRATSLSMHSDSQERGYIEGSVVHAEDSTVVFEHRESLARPAQLHIENSLKVKMRDSDEGTGRPNSQKLRLRLAYKVKK